MIPPDIINEDTSSDMMVPEGESVRLSCKAKGYPQPHITWRREDNEDIILKDPSGAKERGTLLFCISFVVVIFVHFRVVDT